MAMTVDPVIPSLSISIQSCRVCKSTNINPILDLGLQPLANELREKQSDVNNYFPLILCRCSECGTIQLTETVNPSLLFDEYVWVTGTSDTAIEYSKIFCERALKQIQHIQSEPKVLEIASNDGTFLSQFQKQKCFVLGVDPAKNIAIKATQSGIPTIAEYFGRDQADVIVSKHGNFDIVFARNVIPHVADVYDVVSGMETSLSTDGVGIIEFHRADTILKELHYDSIYHEHVCYHSISSLNKILLTFGLHIYHIEKSPISGGSYVLFFSKIKRPITSFLKQAIENEIDLKITDQSAWDNFAKNSIDNKNKLNKLIDTLLSEGKSIFGYGASARSSTVLNFCQLDSSKIKYIADKSPYKHNKYSPGTDILIVPPTYIAQYKPDVIFILAWNFKSEILEWLDSVNWHGEILLPLPDSPKLIQF